MLIKAVYAKSLVGWKNNWSNCYKMKITYNPKLKEIARVLRNNPTDAELLLWQNLRKDKVMGLDFHRQKPIGNYIVDFYCAELNLVIEVDAEYHFELDMIAKDGERDLELNKYGLSVMRFTNEEVLKCMSKVLDRIRQEARRLKQ